MNQAPISVEVLRQHIVEKNDQLSPRLQEVARYVLDNPHSVAFDTLAVIAQAGGVHASTLIRFANTLGFTGFSELQQLYRDHMVSQSTDYSERIRDLQMGLDNEQDVSPYQLFTEFSEANVLSLKHLQQNIAPKDLEHAIRLMDRAHAIYVCGIRRAFPVSMYFTYALNHIKAKCYPIDGIGVMQEQQANWIGKGDLLIAITFRPYADETQKVITKAIDNGAKVLLMTDSELCPTWNKADLGFATQDAEVRSFRSLNVTMCLAQTLCIALGYRRQSIPLPNDNQT